MHKFHDDPTVNESEIIVFLRQVWWYAKKRKDFGRMRRENEIKRKKRVGSIVSMKTNIRCIYL